MTKALTLKALKYIKQNQPIPRKIFLHKYSTNDLNHLIQLHYISQSTESMTIEDRRYVEKDTDLFMLTDIGFDYLDENATDLRRTWWPHIGNAVLAIIAIIISIIALNK